MKNQVWLSLAWVGIVLSLAVGCTRKGVSDLPLNETLRINVLTEPPTLDWHKATDLTSANLIANLMEGLVQFDFPSGSPRLIPALALKWEPSEGGKKWKFQLRRGVVWSDGVPFTEKHVVDAWRRLLSRETASDTAHMLYPIKNAQAFNGGKKTWDEVGVKVTAPFEVTVELERPLSFFPLVLRGISTYPIRLDVIEKHGDKWTEPGNIVTLGPFNLKSWAHDKLLVLERNDKYYGEKAKTKYVSCLMIVEQATAINLFDSGKIDSVHSLPSIEVANQSKRPEYRRTSLFRTYFYGFNTQLPPVDDPLVRRAIAMAIDRDEVVKMLAGGERPLSGWVPQGLLGSDPDVGVKFNPIEARALLKRAGYDGGKKKFPLISLSFNTNEDHKRIAENVQAQLKRNLGIGVELKNEEWKVYLSSLKTNPSHLFRLGWQAQYPDPHDFMVIMAGYSENNRTRWKDPKYDELVVTGAALADETKRAETYRRAQKIMLEDAVATIPLFSSVSHMLVSPRTKDYPVNAIEAQIFKGAGLAQ